MKSVSTALNPLIPEPPKQSLPNESLGSILWLLGTIGLVALLVISLVSGQSLTETVWLLCSVTSLIWAIWVTVWICKIKNRQTEAVKVQTEAVEILANILSELKKQNC